MPKWNTHLEVAKRVNGKLKFSGKDLEKFYLGNILPDINNGWLVQGIHKRILHDETHICAENEFAWKHFYDKYKEKIESRDPIVMGYLLHLMTDTVFNDDFYKSIIGTWLDEEEKDRKRILKQEDFAKFDQKFLNDFEMKNIYEDMIATKIIDEVEIEEEDLRKTNEYLRAKEEKITRDWNFCTEEWLDDRINKTIKKFEQVVFEEK